MLKGQDVRCMFPEAGADPGRYVWLAEGTDTKVGAALDPEGRMLAEGPGLYEQLLTDIGTAVADCLAGK
jgi:zinc transport system substrate-binding protein